MKRRKNSAIVASLSLAACACGSVATSHAPTADRVVDAAVDASSTALVHVDAGDSLASSPLDAGADAQATALAPLRWGTRPDRSAEYAYVIDGYCVQADIDLLENATLIHYGEHGHGYAAHMTDDGLDGEAALSKGFNGYYFGKLQGTWPDNLWIGVDDGGRAYTSLHHIHWNGTEWSYGFGETDSPNRQSAALLAIPGGAIAAITTCGDDGSCSGATYVGQGVKAPPFGGTGFQALGTTSMPNGEIWAFGNQCSGDPPSGTCTSIVKRWKAGANVIVETLIQGLLSEPASLAIAAPNDVYLATYENVFHYDGAKITPFAWDGKLKGGAIHRAPDESLWLMSNGKIERRPKEGGARAIAVPGAVTALEGVEAGAPHIVMQNGGAARWASGAWQKIVVPKSPFAWNESKTNSPLVERIRVRSPSDVWLNVKYVEWPSHWGDQQFEERRALLRTIAPKETKRCIGPNGFSSSPPLATASCTTPLVILASVPVAQKTDYPQSRKLVKGKTELEGTRYVELTVGDQKMLGAKVPSYDVGKRLLALMRANIPYVKSEMVCADPENATELTLP